MGTHEIPSWWEAANLSDIVSKLVDGSHNPPAKQGAGLPMLSAVNINNNKIIFSDYRLISENAFLLEDKRTRISPGDVLLTIVGAIGRAAVVTEAIPKFTLQRSVAVITPQLISSKFLMYQFGSPRIVRHFTNNARGTAQKGVYLKTLGNTEIWLPPLPEQHRIVAKIEELFSELDKGIDSLKTAQAQLKVYRQALLKHAFEGKLTAAWREQNRDKQAVTPAKAGVQPLNDMDSRLRGNDEVVEGGNDEPLETAAALQQRIQHERAERYRQQLADWQANGGSKPKAPKLLPPLTAAELAELPELPEGWAWTRLGNTNVDVSDGPFGSNLKSSDYVDAGVRVVRLENIGALEFIEDKESFITEAKYELLKNHTVKSGDIIFSSFITENVRVALLPASIQRAVNKADCFCVRLFGETLSNAFAVMFLSTRHVFKQLEAQIHGVGRPRINTTQLKEVAIPVCGIQEQQAIISLVDARLSEADQLEQTLATSLQQAEALRQSILKRAFSGQLVAQDPHDEPAAALLARIRAARATADKSSVARSRGRKAGGK